MAFRPAAGRTACPPSRATGHDVHPRALPELVPAGPRRRPPTLEQRRLPHQIRDPCTEIYPTRTFVPDRQSGGRAGRLRGRLGEGCRSDARPPPGSWVGGRWFGPGSRGGGRLGAGNVAQALTDGGIDGGSGRTVRGAGAGSSPNRNTEVRSPNVRRRHAEMFGSITPVTRSRNRSGRGVVERLGAHPAPRRPRRDDDRRAPGTPPRPAARCLGCRPAKSSHELARRARRRGRRGDVIEKAVVLVVGEDRTRSSPRRRGSPRSRRSCCHEVGAVGGPVRRVLGRVARADDPRHGRQPVGQRVALERALGAVRQRRRPPTPTRGATCGTRRTAPARCSRTCRSAGRRAS